MGKYKYEFLHFFARDYRTYEKHFQEMAQKGYFIDTMAGWYFKYRKDEPQNRIYSFDFNEGAHSLDGAQSKDNLEYRDFIEASGWEHVLTLANINLFSNRNIYASSLHSDDLMFYKSMNFDQHHSKTSSWVLPLIVIGTLLILSCFGWSKYILSNSQMLFEIGVIFFETFAFIYRLNENRSLKANKKLLESGRVPEARSLEEIKRASVLGIIDNFTVLPLLIRHLNLGSFGVLIIATLILGFIYVYMSKNKHNYIVNGMILVASFGLLLFFATIPNAYGFAKKNMDPNLFLPGHIERVYDYEQTSSIFVKRHDYLDQEDSEVIEGFDNSIIVDYIDSRYDFITDLLFNDYMDRFDITQEHRISHSHYEEVYETYYLNQGNVYIKYEIVLIRDGNQIVFINTSNKELFDIDGIIKDCFKLK